MTYEDCRKQADYFRKLVDDWDGNGAIAPSSNVISKYLDVIRFLECSGANPPLDVYPGMSGNLVIDYENHDLDIDENSFIFYFSP